MQTDREPTATRPTCYGRSARDGRITPCPSPAMYETLQSNGKNPKYACGRHIGWLLRFRTVPGRSITVTRLEIKR